MAPFPSSVGGEYIQLAFQVNRFLKETLGENTIIVDSYFGPKISDELKHPINPDDLIKSLTVLQDKVRKDVQKEPRRTFLVKQLDAMILLVNFTLEEGVTFEQQVRVGLDIEPVTIKSERIEELHEEAVRALQRKERKADLATMATRWRKRALVTGNEVVTLAQESAAEARSCS